MVGIASGGKASSMDTSVVFSVGRGFPELRTVRVALFISAKLSQKCSLKKKKKGNRSCSYLLMLTSMKQDCSSHGSSFVRTTGRLKVCEGANRQDYAHPG